MRSTGRVGAKRAFTVIPSISNAQAGTVRCVARIRTMTYRTAFIALISTQDGEQAYHPGTT